MDCSREPSNAGKFVDELRRAYQEYLGVPSMIVAAFIVLGIGMVSLEQAQIPAVDRLRGTLSDLVFGDVDATRDILTSSAATLITITSITFTVLLLAVQQAASAMSTQIIDQFLRRPINQVLFGYFVGMSIYSLVILAAVRSDFSPVMSTALSFVFAGFALYFLAALVYITLTQMRSAIVVHAIHDETLKARQRWLPLLATTRRTPQLQATNEVSVLSRGDGYVDRVELATIRRALPSPCHDCEVVLRVRIGSYVAHGDEVARIRTSAGIDTPSLSEKVLRAIKLTRARDLDHDPAHGVEQIMNIGWTSISSAQHNPSAGAQAIHALRDLLALWSTAETPRADGTQAPIVYEDDLPILPLRAIESLAVAAVESRQHQSFGHALRAIGSMYGRLPPDLQMEVEAIVLRLISGLKNQVLTTELDEALEEVARMFERAGRRVVADAVRRARAEQRAVVARLVSE
jgi:uncharacterized membrane protein